MGSFKGHIVPGTLFLVVGIWHLGNSIIKYLVNPSSFKARAWHPLPFCHGKARYLEIYIITLGALFDMCIEFFYSTRLQFVVDGGLNSAHLNDFEHSGMLLMFFLFGLIAIISETTQWLPLPDGALYIIAAMAFTSEFLLFHFHSTNHAGLEGRYHELLVISIGLCIICSLLVAAFPSSFVLDLACGLAVTLQGLWFYQTAFTLYGPWLPNGCTKRNDGPVCESTGMEIRGLSLANSQFNVLATLLLASVITFYGTAANCLVQPRLPSNHDNKEVGHGNTLEF